MAPQHIHLIRHAQGHHNLCIANHSLRDPSLTTLGEQQCSELWTTHASTLKNVDLIIASPLRRTLYTALLTFKSHLAANPSLRIVALPDIQETTALPCDTGSSPEALREEFKDYPAVDLSLVQEGWNEKHEGAYRPRTDLIARRTARARRFFRECEGLEVAVVAHGGLMHFLTEDWAGSMAGTGTGWKNCELRTYTFDESGEAASENASLRETDESLKRRSQDLIPLTVEEQTQLREIAQESWVKDGFIRFPTREEEVSAHL
ncbi:phosphoglycerate mutase family protein-like protein [Aaosphaeria arxii CBS 175.79]|uniref:Phosphoglycerate mutase family protein-like protein n=1 Tax=Aaosphaeria arxii CBS 175.79 TaxID=1450172 RepID=A0A6A5Y5N6_9PLEO|nr:phosphoglycerate mutase family protein-like protein [Aaosphaeria arxii CBS 175.79]KAF2020865.1 phosphoglycerate mutase family protein-like protein [Aaosphaeria arxii CBS 175.79]